MTTAALLAAVAADTAGQGVEVPQSDGGLLGVAPAREDAVGTPPVPLSATKVFNSTQTTYRVEIELSTLVQDRSGSLEASKYARDRVRAEKMLSITPDGFLIGPGEQRVIVSEWRRVIPQRARAAFIAFVVRAVPQVEQSDGIVIAPTARIIAARLLRIPSPDKARGRIVGFTARQAEERVLQFTTSVRNTGKVHAEPTDASFRILDSRRREVFRSRLPDGVVLPRFVRDFPITVRKRLPAGDYRAVTRLTFGRSKLTRSRRFTLTGPNLLPTRELEITALEASGEEKGPAKAVATVENTGTADAPIVLKAELLRVVDGLPDAKPLATKTVERDGSQPGSVQQIEFELGELGSGTFRVLAAVGDGRRRYNKFAADFVSDAHRSLPTRAKDLVVDNGAVLAIIAAFLIALGGLLWSRARIRRAEARSVGGTASHAAGPAPSATGVDTPPREAAHEPEPAAQEPDPDAAEPPARDIEPSATEPPAPELEVAAAPEPGPPPLPPPATPGDAAIDINRATADELLKLPGVGRKAAERIVAYRSQHGPFASIDDLANVEGFDDPARVRRLAQRATV